MQVNDLWTFIVYDGSHLAEHSIARVSGYL